MRMDKDPKTAKSKAMTTDCFIAEAGSWDVFFSRACALPASAPGKEACKGSVFERLTQLYLTIHSEYRTKLKHVWRAKEELPPAVRSRINLPRTDEGIDLVAETFDGDLWAIQCKFRTDTRAPLTVGELSTFTNLAFNYCNNISLAVVVHTCAKPVKKKQYLGKATEIGLERWLELEAEDWRQIREATAKPPSPPKPREPRPHQQKAIAAAKEHFISSKETRGRLIMPCGTGKSLTAFWIAEALKARSILVAVPSLHLIKQSLADWTKEFLARGEIPDWLVVCSDETTGKLEDDFVSDSYELGVDATTDRDEIGRFLSKKSAKKKIVFSTYQSGKPLAAAARSAGFSFDLGIMDEAHRTVGSPDKSFGHLITDKNVAIRKRLFMTATERVVREKDETVLSMDDSEVYGKCFHQLTFKEAIEADPPIISDYKIITITVSDESVKRFIEDNSYLKTGDEELGQREAQALAAGIALQRAFREEGVKHTISFHRSIRSAEDFREQQEQIESRIKDIEPPRALHISSRKTAGERAELLREFREANTALITNARCLQEGVDIPAVDCVLFADPKQSVVDIVQAAGRAMRPCKGKKFGYIVVPIVVPSGMAFADFAETTEFKQVGRVVTALSTQDDRIAEEFRGVKAKGNGKEREERIVEIKGDVPVAQHIDLEAFREQVRLKLWERVGRANWRPFQEAREWVRGLGLKNEKNWRIFSKSKDLPPDIPATPNSTYKNKGWSGMGDWLGTGRTFRGHCRPFLKAREFARSLGLKNFMTWVTFCSNGNLPNDIPSAPQVAYRNSGWVSWGDWLGTGAISSAKRQYLSFENARSFAKSLQLSNQKQWQAFARSGELPNDIPAVPNHVYRNDGWDGYGDWLGTENIAKSQLKYRPFTDARNYARSLGLRNREEWNAFAKSGGLPSDIPVNAWQTYRGKGFVGWGDWLGTNRPIKRIVKYMPFTKARTYARKQGLKNVYEWRDFCKGGKLPADIPATPNQIYGNQGWVGWSDWLGNGRSRRKK